MTETTQQDLKAWVCFHCGEICKTETEAVAHFGVNEQCEPMCVSLKNQPQGAIGLIRELQAEIIDMRNELWGEGEIGQALYQLPKLKADLKRYFGTECVHTAYNTANDAVFEKAVARGEFTKLESEIQALRVQLDTVKSARLSQLYLSNFFYESWDFGDDSVMRIGDWVHLGYQDHNGNDYSDGYGKIVTHHDTEIPVMLMVEGFEDDGEPHGTYAPICYHPWNTISRVAEKTVRDDKDLAAY